jgi:hypothetical protein
MDRTKASWQGRGAGSRWPSLSRRLLPVAGAVAMTALMAWSAAAQAEEPSPDASAAPSASASAGSLSVDTASPSPLAASGPGILGAGVALYEDDFDDAASWIDLGKDENGRTALEDGGLLMSIKGTNVNYRDWYELAEPVAVLRVEALVDIDERAGTGGGVACGSALGLPRWFIAGVNNADEWYFARQIEGRFQLVDRGPLMLPIESSTSAVRVAIECAVAPDAGGDYVAISVDGRPVSVAMGLGRLDIPVGPFGRAGLYVATDEGTGSARFDDMTVHMGDAFVPAPIERDADRASQ